MDTKWTYSVNTKWNYDPNRCDGHYCCGNCWWCKLSPDHDGELDDHEEDGYGE